MSGITTKNVGPLRGVRALLSSAHRFLEEIHRRKET